MSDFKVVKMILVGHSRVGKTSLITRYVDGTFTDGWYSTVGIDFKIKHLTIEGDNIKLQIWEPGGGERFRTLAPSYYRAARAVLLVYDTNDRESFTNLETFQKEMSKCIDHPQTLRVLVGNKLDLEQNVAEVEAEEYAKTYGMMYYECSAKTGDGVENMMDSIATKIKLTPELWICVQLPTKVHLLSPVVSVANI